MSVLLWIVAASAIGGLLSVAIAALFALNARASQIPVLISFAVGALLAAVFLDILPHAFSMAADAHPIAFDLVHGHPGSTAFVIALRDRSPVQVFRVREVHQVVEHEISTERQMKVASHRVPSASVVEVDRKSTRLNSSHVALSRMPSSA